MIVGGKIVRVELEDAGEGYSAAPRATVPGFAQKAVVEIGFERRFEKNGRVKTVRLSD